MGSQEPIRGQYPGHVITLDQSEPFPDDPWFHDVNFYLKDGDCDKSNLNPRYHQAKVAKADLDVMIRNILEDDDCKEKDDDQDDKDSVHNLKLSLSKKNNLS